MLTLLYNAQIRTMHPSLACAEAAVLDGERFSFVGSQEGARLFLAGRAHDALDAQGATVLPGFNDAHMHFVHEALRRANVDLAGAHSVEDVLTRLRKGLPDRTGEWLIGEGWNQEAFAEKRLLTRADLDSISVDVPIFARRACGHLGVANSRALAMAGLDVPDGILREDEQGAIWGQIPTPDVSGLLHLMASAQQGLYAKGITSVQSDDFGYIRDIPQAVYMRAVRDAGDTDAIQLRYAFQALMTDLRDAQMFFADDLHAISGKRFHVAHMKLLADGSLGARTAWLSVPYADAPESCGISLYEDATLRALVREAASHGLPTAIHAIGDAAMQQTLDAIEAEGRGLRNAVVHAQITNAGQVVRCGSLGLTIMAQPIFLQADLPIVRARVGDALADTSYRWRAMAGAGAHVAFSTDCPVEPFDPMPGIYCAVTRHGVGQPEAYLPDERFTLDEAIYAYTAAGAYASGEEADKGRIWPGMLADFVVLDHALDDHEPTSLLQTGIAATYIGGKPVYTK